jgi:hypothetical protein
MSGNIPSNLDLSQMIQVLRSFGISPENLGPDRLEKLQQLSANISDPTKITPEFSRQLLDILGISTRGKQIPRKETVKIGRNDLCTCNSKIKYKKCCGKKE